MVRMVRTGQISPNGQLFLHAVRSIREHFRGNRLAQHLVNFRQLLIHFATNSRDCPLAAITHRQQCRAVRGDRGFSQSVPPGVNMF